MCSSVDIIYNAIKIKRSSERSFQDIGVSEVGGHRTAREHLTRNGKKV